MKKAILFLLIISAVAANAQTQKPSLKDLLYSGKLKSDSNSVVRSSDDLSTKIDTATKKPAAPEKPKATAANNTTDSSVANKTVASTTKTDSSSGNATTTEATTATTAETTAEPKAATAPTKSNTKLWKEYSDSLISNLKTEVLSSKKIKKESYYMMVDYEIGTDGQVDIVNVTSTPENSFLQDQVKERMLATPLKLAPALDSAGNPRKVKRKYSFTVTKD